MQTPLRLASSHSGYTLLARLIVLSLGGGLLACGSDAVQHALDTGRVDQAIAAQREPAELERIALHVLIAEARSADLGIAQSAWAALRGLGAWADDAWAALDHEPSDHFTALTRAQVLAARSALGDAVARRDLRAQLSSPDLEIAALAIEALDGARDEEKLRELARSTSADVRRSAIAKLRDAQPSTAETRLLLEEIARIDPIEGVRATALRALMRVAFAEAQPHISGLLNGPPSMLSLEVAQDVLVRASSQREPTLPDALVLAARDQLEAALAGKESSLRARASAALLASAASIDTAALRDRIAALLTTERDRSMRLLFALALASDARGIAALETLAQGKDVPGAQAAAALSTHRDPAIRTRARERLRALLKSPQPAVRATAAPALASSLDIHTARSALIDPNARVRIATAAALIRALSQARQQR